MDEGKESIRKKYPRSKALFEIFNQPTPQDHNGRSATYYIIIIINATQGYSRQRYTITGQTNKQTMPMHSLGSTHWYICAFQLSLLVPLLSKRQTVPDCGLGGIFLTTPLGVLNSWRTSLMGMALNLSKLMGCKVCCSATCCCCCCCCCCC